MIKRIKRFVNYIDVKFVKIAKFCAFVIMFQFSIVFTLSCLRIIFK